LLLGAMRPQLQQQRRLHSATAGICRRICVMQSLDGRAASQQQQQQQQWCRQQEQQQQQ
jgi:hypothetical protein